MIRRCILALLCAVAVSAVFSATQARADQRAFGRVWGGAYRNHDWDRFYHYPFVYYPQNFWGSEYYRSAESLYYRYPPEMRIPVYNETWFSYYPENRQLMKSKDGLFDDPGRFQRYHHGHQFILDVF